MPLKLIPHITAAFCLRVPLMELLCYGAEPIAVIDLIGNEYAPTGGLLGCFKRDKGRIG